MTSDQSDEQAYSLADPRRHAAADAKAAAAKAAAKAAADQPHTVSPLAPPSYTALTVIGSFAFAFGAIWLVGISLSSLAVAVPSSREFGFHIFVMGTLALLSLSLPFFAVWGFIGLAIDVAQHTWWIRRGYCG